MKLPCAVTPAAAACRRATSGRSRRGSVGSSSARVDRELNNRLGIRVCMPDVFDVVDDDDVPETMTDPSYIRDFLLVRDIRRQLVSMT